MVRPASSQTAPKTGKSAADAKVHTDRFVKQTKQILDLWKKAAESAVDYSESLLSMATTCEGKSAQDLFCGATHVAICFYGEQFELWSDFCNGLHNAGPVPVVGEPLPGAVTFDIDQFLESTDAHSVAVDPSLIMRFQSTELVNLKNGDTIPIDNVRLSVRASTPGVLYVSLIDMKPLFDGATRKPLRPGIYTGNITSTPGGPIVAVTVNLTESEC